MYPGVESPAQVGDLTFAGIETSNVDFGHRVACAVQSSGGVYCWGRGLSLAPFGTIGVPGVALVGGSGEPTIPGAGPAQVGEPMAQVESAATAVCGATVEGRLRCWGHNFFGQLGRGHTDAIGFVQPPSVGSSIDLGDRIAAFAESVYSDHFCAILEGGALKCWGHNHAGQLGYGHTLPLGDQPGEVGPALPAVQVF